MSRRPLGDHWLQEYSHFREMGFSDEAIAARLGITLDGLSRRFARMNNRPSQLVAEPEPVEYPEPGSESALAEQSIEVAAEVICRIREEDTHGLWADLSRMTPNCLLSLVFTLAAMVPDDRTVGQLLAWTEPLAAAS
ncbi:hypothetical protein CH249_25865 [Rhodococcus sp. 05-2255-3B1]|uniref:hypothetical protein n=1 Tax=Rhodococcus sp. 05-2255-3B1 TaxID=2022482 RepID=UPI000B9A93D0|nr:hypothetical protein [Rhodococcus sp. 05-2255-3B1]OZE04363.1 hypothetical protein CH249_25865 [Rhodococcus sp. 05-2255-3B1]